MQIRLDVTLFLERCVFYGARSKHGATRHRGNRRGGSSRGERKPLRLSLADLMKVHNVPHEHRGHREMQDRRSKNYGVIEVGSNTPVTTHTLYQAGSINKPVAATGALRPVEQGKLSLDENVNVKLKTWKVPENDFTKTDKVTLRRLMSHGGAYSTWMPRRRLGRSSPNTGARTLPRNVQ